MKIALMYGKGRDGCGVQKYGTETIKWAKANGHIADFYSLEERFFGRGGQNPVKSFIGFKGNECKAIAEQLEQYDIVIFQSYPSNAHKHECVKQFFEHIVQIKNPIKVMYMHELNKTNIDKIPYVLPILNEADIIYTFGEDTWFSKKTESMLESKKRGDRIRKFQMIIDYSAIERFRKPISELRRELTFVGRWSHMKDPSRICDLAPEMWKNSINPQMIGLERSVGMKFDVLDHPNAPVQIQIHKPEQYDAAVAKVAEFHEKQTHVPIMSEYEFNWAFDTIISKSMFGASFYRMPHHPENYSDRMEYTQIEMIAAGCVPVFDKHWGEHNYTKSGERFIDVPYSAIYSDKGNLEETVKILTKVSNDPDLIHKYREVSLEVIRNEYDVNTSMPILFADVLKLGKDKNKHKSVSEVLNANRAYNLESYFISENQRLVVTGFNEIENDYTRYLDGRKEVAVKHYANRMSDFL